MTGPVGNRPTKLSVAATDNSKPDVGSHGQQPGSGANLRSIHRNIDKTGPLSQLRRSASQSQIAKVDSWQTAKPASMFRSQSAPVLGTKQAPKPASKGAFIDSDFMKGLRNPFEDDLQSHPNPMAESEAVNPMTDNPFAPASDTNIVKKRRKAKGQMSRPSRTADAKPATDKTQFTRARPEVSNRPKAGTATRSGLQRLDSEPKTFSAPAYSQSNSGQAKALEGINAVAKELRENSSLTGKLKKTLTSAARTVGKASGRVATEEQKRLRSTLPSSLADRLDDHQISDVHRDMKERSAAGHERLKKLMGGSLSEKNKDDPELFLNGFELGRKYALDKGSVAEYELCKVLMNRISRLVNRLPNAKEMWASLPELEYSHHLSLDYVVALAKLLPEGEGKMGEDRAKALILIDGAKHGLLGIDPQPDSDELERGGSNSDAAVIS